MTHSVHPEAKIHESAYVDPPCLIGQGTRIWHFSHIQSGARIGSGCVLGQNVNISNDVQIGDNVRIQNNVSVFTGCKIEDNVFLGPSCVLTNITNPRAEIRRNHLYETTLFRKGATVGANATIVSGITLGRHCFIGAGAVVLHDVPDYALMIGNPARQAGWMSRHGHRLQQSGENGIFLCPESGLRYRLEDDNTLRCLDIGEDEPLPTSLKTGRNAFDTYKNPG